MLKKLNYIFVAITLFCFQQATAQNNPVSAGNNASNDRGSTAYSIGQTFYQNYKSSGGYVDEGLQHAIVITEITGIATLKDTHAITVYPNPTNSFITIEMNRTGNKEKIFHLYDEDGQPLEKGILNGTKTDINMTTYPTAIYFLKIMQSEEIISTYKIIKTN